jgi:RNA polymerase sigma-70 factor (ECF subfamily)
MWADDTPDDVDRALTRLTREQSGRVLALLARRYGDVDLADESVQDALAEAARTWPERGIPTNPPAWLMAVARRKAIDRLRRASSARRRTTAAAPALLAAARADLDAAEGADTMIDDSAAAIADDHLRLVLLCCHPSLERDTQVALTLRLVGGLTTAEIAAAFLLPEATLAQRIVRAKRKIRDAGIPLSIPANLDQRVEAVLSVLYLIFNEGYLSRGAGEAAVRVDLIDESVRLAELMITLVPNNAEALGLLSLQLFHRARTGTRVDAMGELVLLEHQDRTRWDLAEIRRANAVLHEAMRLMHPGAFQLQAIIAGHHANARTAADTDWVAVVTAYGHLAAVTQSPIVRVNHAVAVAMADGPQAGLAMLEQLDGVQDYHLFHAARGELLLRADRHMDAATAFDRAATLTDNPAEQRHLVRRRAACG